eukprot:1897034-Pyramimonas_sp.AAC.1
MVVRPPLLLPPPPEPDDLCQISKKLKTRTCTPDGFHPKHFGRLEDSTLEVMGKPIAIMNILSDAPQQMQSIILLLARKHSGGGEGEYWAISQHFTGFRESCKRGHADNGKGRFRRTVFGI